MPKPSRIDDIDTPAVLIDVDRATRNIGRAQAYADRSGLKLRPHVKTHKLPFFAWKQVEAGARGITCQKIGEAEVFADTGVADDILITFNIVGDAKVGRLMDLAERVPRLTVVADNEVVLQGLSAGAHRRGRELPVLVECDTGFGRNGVQTPQAALELARFAERLPGLRFAGLMVFPNTAPKTHAFFTERPESASSSPTARRASSSTAFRARCSRPRLSTACSRARASTWTP